MKDVCILSFHFLNKDFSEHHFEKKKDLEERSGFLPEMDKYYEDYQIY